MIDDSARTDESDLEPSGEGLAPADDGWFIVNVKAARWRESDRFGAWTSFEGAAKFGGFGINVTVLQPGMPACLYHREGLQEGFLVLQGEAEVVVNGERRPLRQWDYFHCPPQTDHVLVGGGDGPCAILMVGVRHPDMKAYYPVDPEAAASGASVAEATGDPRQAYGAMELREVPAPWPSDESSGA